jgi:hypothetical protein
LLPSKEIKTMVPAEKDKPNKIKYIQLHANAILSAIEGGFARRKLNCNGLEQQMVQLGCLHA